MTILDSEHTFAFYVKPAGGSFTNKWSHVRRNSVSVVDAAGAEVDTLTIELENYDGSLTFTEWSECYLQVDGASYLFYGYITKVRPRAVASGDWLIYELRCESSATLLGSAAGGIGKSNTVTGTWANTSIQNLVNSVFTAGGVTGWDTTTYVDTGPTLKTFTAKGEGLSSVLDRIVLTAKGQTKTDWVWRCEANKVLRLGEVSGNSAPFGIATLLAADWATTFPISGVPEVGLAAADTTVESNGSGIVNEVTVESGSAVSVETTETFSGDGTTYLFTLAHMPVNSITRITVGGALQSYGTDWYDSFGGGYNTLVNFAGGTVSWPEALPPAAGSNNISITYRWTDTVAYNYTGTDSGSVTHYGMTFGATIHSNCITSQQQAKDLADAVLAEYAYGTIEGSFTVERYGLRAGQTIGIELPVMGLTGQYTIQRVTTEIDKAASGVKATVKFGGHPQTLSNIIFGITGEMNAGSGSGAYYQPTLPSYEGTIGVMSVGQRIEFLDPLTAYEDPI